MWDLLVNLIKGRKIKDLLEHLENFIQEVKQEYGDLTLAELLERAKKEDGKPSK